jgi:23S rRNA (guanosine2251-2'-O)-methyltransferase
MQIEGRNPVIELLRSKRWIKKVIVQIDINVDEKINEILKRSQNRGVFIERKSKKFLDHMTETKSHQGVIAIAKVEFVKLENVIEENNKHKKPNVFMYIREALYDENIGAIARSAEAAGFSGIVMPPKMEISSQAFRTSMGAMSNIKIIRDSLFNAIKTAKANQIKVIGIERDTDDYYWESDMRGDVMLIIGGEDKPLSVEVMDKCDQVVKIPMTGKVNSLNMSVAAGIVIFEKMRQETITKL